MLDSREGVLDLGGGRLGTSLHGFDFHAHAAGDSSAADASSSVVFRSFPFHELLLLHPPVLKPYFDLSFGEVEHVGQFHSPLSRDVSVHDEFPLQPSGLRSRVGNSLFPARGGEFDDRRPVLVGVHVVGKRVSQAGNVRRQNRRRHAAGRQRGRLRQT